MKQLLLLSSIVLLTLSCAPKNDGFVIHGFIDGIKDSALITLYDLSQQVDIDTAYALNGEFVLNGMVDQPTGCWIRCNGENVNIQMENTKFSFKSPLENMNLYSEIVGGKEQELQNELMKLQKPFDLLFQDAYDSLINQKYSDDAEQMNLINRINESQSTTHEIYVNYGIEHSYSYMGLNIVYMNRNSISRDTLKRVYENLPSPLCETQNAKALRTYIYEKSVEVGHPYIDFEVKTIDGRDFKLSSLDGRYIYLSFWSAGCGPCRIENRFLSKHYNAVPEELSIVSFSVDKNEDNWLSASKSDSVIWHNISDGEGSNGRIKTQYQVQAIPTSFLIDKEGNVIKRFKGYDPQKNLLEELEAIINNL